MKKPTKQEQINHVSNILILRNILKKSFLSMFFILISTSNLVAQGIPNLRTLSFDKGWSFIKDNPANAEEISFDDSYWRKVNLPHDWSIEDLPNQTPDNIVGPFTKKSIGKAATGWTEGGTGWYRKKFVTEKNQENKLVSIHFDGVYMNSDVWINGKHVGNQPYGYTPFYYDLTPYLKPVGQQNTIAVKVRNEGKNSRWYSGSGIYRNVYLTTTDPVHVGTWGVYITTPEVTQTNATVKVKTAIANKQSTAETIKYATTIVDPKGKIVGKAEKEVQLGAGKTVTDEQSLIVINPSLWSLETPQLYKAITEIKKVDKVIDRVETVFGIRTIKADVTGFHLNGTKIILKGGCIHHDNGPLGAMAFGRAEERKIEILKKNGFNAIRTSHNPPSQALLNACDRLGMLVIDEAFDTWVRPKNPEDYSISFNEWWKKDLEAILLRDRNHPSIIMWSIGNEIWEAPDYLGVEIAQKLIDEVRRLDSTRPITEAFVYTPPYTKQPLENYIPHANLLDIEGYNYFLEVGQPHFQRDDLTTNFLNGRHTSNPNKAIVISESLPLYALENFNKSEQSPWMIGSFKWTAFDYMGEAGLGKSRVKPVTGRPDLKGLIGMGVFFKDEWPIYNSGSGDFDVIGGKKQASYYQDVVWKISPMEILVHYPIPEGKREAIATWGFPEELKSWTWPGQEGKKLQVHVYSRCELVKLELNGKVIAVKPVLPDSITTTFEVDYAPGTLVAKGMTRGKVVCTNTLTTAGKAVGIRLVADRGTINADFNDLSYVNVEVIDSKGNVVTNIDDLEITYQLSGNATIAGVGNGNAADMSSFQQPKKKVYQGRGLVIVRSNGTAGKITLKATANNLKAATIDIVTK
nr:glycoside hydrolase family 2 TIM barrel-domain containing protein [uncultured Flavobacterium sp.]